MLRRHPVTILRIEFQASPLLFPKVPLLSSFQCRPKEAELTDRILTIPNIMSGIRFILAPAIGYMAVKGLFLPGLYSSAEAVHS